MPLIIDDREVDAILEALRVISIYLGNESEYRRFAGWTRWAEKSETNPSQEEIAKHTPYFVRVLSPPLRRLYGDGYNNGFEDAGALWRGISSP